MLEVLEIPHARARSPITLPGYRAGMPPPNAGRKFPAEVLTRDEFSRLLAACSRRGSAGLRMRALLVVLYRSGLRIAEALSLEPKDVDFESRSITVLHGKGDKRRVVGIDDQALAVVEKWMERRRALGIPRGRVIFCVLSEPTKGKPMYSSVVREAMKDLGLKAGIEKRVHPHGLRHAFASELSREGVSLTVIQTLLGHSDLATTARYVAHLTPWEAIERIHSRPAWNADHGDTAQISSMGSLQASTTIP